MKKNIVKIMALMIPLSILIVFIGEAILRQELFGALRWLINSPVNFMINGCIIWIVLMILCSLLNKVWKAFALVSVVYITGCIVSFYKFIISGEYLIPADLLLIGEATSISKEMNISIERNIVIGVLIVGVLIWSVYRLDHMKLQREQRWILGIVGVSALVLMIGVGLRTVIQSKKVTPVLKEVKGETVNEEYDEKGFLVGFSEELPELIIEEPIGYSKEKVQEILKPYEGERNTNFIKPNIIMIMSESFFEVNHLDGVNFSENPLKYFESYQDQFVKGNVITAVYGGRTCQTEYEVLTGNSVEFTGPDNIAYMRFVDETVPSIPKLLKKEGYSTMAIHAYEREFFSRDKAYEDLGIDEFFASESFVNPDTARGYISDQEVVKKVIQTYEAKGDQPLFIHAVTMQNHMPYDELYTGNRIRVESERLTEEEINLLTTYANGINDSDRALKQLIDYFSQVKEPTLIVMYGDHLPDLGKDYKVYENSEYIRGILSPYERFKLHQTPLLMWNNYGLPSEDLGYIDASLLGSTMLDYIGYHKDAYMNFLLDAKHTLKAYHTAFIIDGKGELKVRENLTEGQKSLLEKMWILQYDRLFKEDEECDS